MTGISQTTRVSDKMDCRTESELSAINERLCELIGPQKYRIWFGNSTRLALPDGFIRVSVPNSFMAGWLKRHFSEHINKAVIAATGRPRKLTFAVEPALAGQKKPPADKQPGAAHKSESNSHKTAMRRRRKPKKQFKLTLENFVVGRSNQLAYNAAQAIVSEPESPFNPLFVHGGHGLGKTHILQGICNAFAKNRAETDWLYLSAEDFANQFVLALKSKKLEAFRRRMRRTDLLAIDDIHFLASKPSMQEEFLHTFNTISLAQKQVVLVSDAHPKQIGRLSEKLVNRFVSGMVVKIEPPDFETRCKICRKHAGRIKLTVPENVIEYIAGNISTNVRELEGAQLKLMACSQLQSRSITLSMAKELLAEHLAHIEKVVRLTDIESAVSDYFDITAADIHSAKKGRTFIGARHFCMYLARRHTRMSLAEIGRSMGGKNHATVLSACKKIDGLVAKNADINWQDHNGNRIEKAGIILEQLERAISGN